MQAYKLLAILGAALWGFIFPLSRFQVLDYPPLLSLAMRFSILTVLALPLLEKPKESFGKVFAMAALYMLIPFVCFTLALEMVDASIVALANQLEPLVLSCLAALFFAEKMTAKNTLGMVLAILGVYFILQAPSLHLTDWHAPVLLAIALLAFALGTILLKTMNLSGLQAMLWCNVFSTPLIWAFCYFGEKQDDYAQTLSSPMFYGLCLLIGIMSQTSNTIFVALIKRHGINKISPYGLLVPAFTAIGAFFLLGEKLSVQAVFGSLVIIMGVYISEQSTPKMYPKIKVKTN